MVESQSRQFKDVEEEALIERSMLRQKEREDHANREKLRAEQHARNIHKKVSLFGSDGAGYRGADGGERVAEERGVG